jgi:O-antigen ligase
MISGIVYFAGMIPNDTIHAIYLHATRNTQGARLLSASGRTTRIFPLLWNLIKQAPVIGYGWRADRRVAFTDGQNGFLYALLCGGFLGGLGFIAGLLAAWVMIVRLLWHITRLSLEQRTMLIQVTAITMFFTLRTIPENCAALYSVDFMIQLPALVYLGELDRQLRRAIIRRRQGNSGGVN